tara:strand:- start:445 stop:1278 length:834 start_codon:yes stop_codon:yes gene_type:complete
MKKITEFLETLFSTANQRIKSPFFGSFIFSWIIINWKPIFYFLFSDDKISLKIKNIETSYEFFQNSILYPLILSFLYVVVFPYINQFIHWLTIKAENSKRIEYHKLKIEQIENSQELAEKEKTLEDIRSGNRDISQLNEKINLLIKDNERLKETILKKDEAISDFAAQLDKTTSELQNSKKNLLSQKQSVKSLYEEYFDLFNEFNEFQNNKISIFFPEITDNIFYGFDNHKIEHHIITNYYTLNLIKDSKKESKNYELTEKGEIFWNLYSELKPLNR